VEDDAVGVEGGARVEALGLAPGQKLLYVLGSDMPCIRLGSRVFGKEFQDGFIFLVGERLAKGLYILQKVGDRF